jgi:8-oxo-dGTP pyrophosphatase MutT (NUDIX family)
MRHIKSTATTSEHTKWKRLGEKTVYKGRVHILEYDVELPNGLPAKYEVDHGTAGAVAVLVTTPKDEIVLSYQYRFPLDEWIYDLPGGGASLGETLEAAVIRECREEVGIMPASLQKLATFYPNPGRSDWSMTVFFCDTYTEAKGIEDDPSETVERVVMPLKDFKKLVDDGKIIDPSLLIAWHTACSKGHIKP